MEAASHLFMRFLSTTWNIDEEFVDSRKLYISIETFYNFSVFVFDLVDMFVSAELYRSIRSMECWHAGICRNEWLHNTHA